MPKFEVSFREVEYHTHGYYVNANDLDEAYKIAEDLYTKDIKPDNFVVDSSRTIEHKVEEL